MNTKLHLSTKPNEKKNNYNYTILYKALWFLLGLLAAFVLSFLHL